MTSIRKISYTEIEKLEKIRSQEGFRINCPECWDNKFHCYINTKKNVFHCFKCGYSGIVTQKPTIKVTTVNMLKRLFIRRPTIQKPVARHVKTLPRHSDSFPKEAWLYLKQRGLTNVEIELNELKYGVDDIYQDSIIFPCTLVGTTCDYFVCRTLEQELAMGDVDAQYISRPKYINAPWPKEAVLYQPRYLGKWNGTIAIVEGPFDAIRVARILPTVALLGKEANQAQIDRLRGLLDDFVIILDSDAHSYAMKLAMKLERGKIVRLPQGKDPGNMSTVDLYKLLLHNNIIQNIIK